MTEFYWQHIDVPDKDIKFIQNLYSKTLPNNDYFFQPLDLPIKSFLNLEVQRFVLIQVAPLAIGRIHTDWRPTTFGHQLALQIPLTNCENSTTSIWSSDYTPPTQYTPNGQPYNYYDVNCCKKITEFKLTKPIIWRTDLPHSVNNLSDSVRRAISIRFKQDPWHLIGKR